MITTDERIKSLEDKITALSNENLMLKKHLESIQVKDPTHKMIHILLFGTGPAKDSVGAGIKVDRFCDHCKEWHSGLCLIEGIK